MHAGGTMHCKPCYDTIQKVEYGEKRKWIYSPYVNIGTDNGSYHVQRQGIT